LLGHEHPNTNLTRFMLATLLSDQERYGESIPLRRQELEVAAKRNGCGAHGTLISIRLLANDLYWLDELEEAETLFREFLEDRQQVLKPSDFVIGRALGGLAKTLEEAGRLEEAAAIAQQTLDHRHEHEGPDSL
ncbi:tetratricopeptide repeat protein, partial [Cyanobium sp. A1C-AMD]|uniref:tetratricopeptide repeat protein n=1 Tax=Cyanobium sp. A1C-AMD TaxID=2823694 RepID=UPI0020CF20DA